MRSQHATAETVMHPESAAPALSGLRLILARAAWAALVALNLVLFVVATPALFVERSAPPGPVRAGLAQLGLSESLYAAYFTGLLAVFGLGCFAVAAVIAWRRSTDFMGLFASLFLVLAGAVNAPNVQALTAVHPALGLPVELSQGTFLAFLILFPLLFPDGRFVPRWMRIPAGLLSVGAFAALFFGGGSASDPPSVLGLGLIVGLLAGAAAQIYRYRRVSNPAQRQQTKWVVFGFTAATAVQVAGILAPLSLPRPGVAALLYNVTDTTVVTLASFFIPLTIGIAILRYRLWDIDLIVNRTLVYGALTAGVVGLYVLVVIGLGGLLQVRGNVLLSLVVTGLAAVLFQPLRERLQRWVNRLMYGERDDPYRVISRLGRRLEGTLAPEAVMPAIVADVSAALRLPRAAIWLSDDDTFHLEASHGEIPTQISARDPDAMAKLGHAPDGLRPADLDASGGYGTLLAKSGAALVLPLTHRGELVGALSLSPRAPGEEFSPADRRLLRDVATQAGAAAHAVRLTVALRSSLEELRRSRERLVAAQEEERRRIQRDLHDGLGPVLASMRLRLEACLDAQTNGSTSEAPLTDDLERLYELVGQATGDIRRLVHDLRPPVLDQLGLIPALRQHCERFRRESGIAVDFEAETDLSVPAAAEAAILRVAQEVLLNVEKHARASRVDVYLEHGDGWLSLAIRDDGMGVDESRDGRAGTGIGSMRERADLLGGEFRISVAPEGGTEVSMRVPVPDREAVK